MSFESVKESIRKYLPKAVMSEVFIEKLGKPLLFVCSKPTIRVLKVYDGLSGLNEVAEIRYNIRKDSVYISSFKVNEEYQHLGIGRMIFEFAMAQADAMGVTSLYGTADPTDPIKGVSSDDEDSYDREVEVLKSIYKKLGCSFFDDKNFVQKWDRGERLKCMDQSRKNMIDEGLKHENIDVM